MRSPISLRIVSTLIIIMGVLRIFLGIVFIPYYVTFILMVSFVIDNLLFGTTCIISGILMLFGKKQGAIIYIISVWILVIFYLWTVSLLYTLNFTIFPLLLLISLIIVIYITKCFKS